MKRKRIAQTQIELTQYNFCKKRKYGICDFHGSLSGQKTPRLEAINLCWQQALKKSNFEAVSEAVLEGAARRKAL
jgi:hypothetical protein